MALNENPVSDRLRVFIKQYITSVEQLEILLLVGKNAERIWTSEQVFKMIQSNPESVTERLHGLAGAGFLKVENETRSEYRFHPKSEELAALVKELEKAYSVARTRIIEMIYSGRISQAQQFADSFKLKRKD